MLMLILFNALFTFFYFYILAEDDIIQFKLKLSYHKDYGGK